MKAMILAAGRGERMRPLTDSLPKALLPVGGQALIEHHLQSLAAAGIKDIVINVAWLGQQIMDYLGDGHRYGVEIQYSDEGAHALETGGGIAQALPLLGKNPFWVVNGDVHARYSFAIPQLAEQTLAHLVLVPNPDHNRRGDFALSDGLVRNTGEVMYTYSGIAYMRPELLAGNPGGAFPLTPLLRAAADRGQLTGELLAAGWTDVGTPARLQAVDALYASKDRP
jgi:N-acetyl-alpha-D-muramate 1-phosphate uridylyltransferase